MRRSVLAALAAAGALAAATGPALAATPMPTDPMPSVDQQRAAVRHYASLGVPIYRAGNQRRYVALTFDDGPGPYTWWSWRGRGFDTDGGWRIDYAVTTSGLARRAVAAHVGKAATYDERWSDHAPLVVDFAEK